jgi:hypothetical protein
VLFQGNRQVARFTGDFFYFCLGMYFNVDMPADLDQFGRDNSHGAVISGEGFVDLSHFAADSGASSNNHHRSKDFCSHIAPLMINIRD